jgi:hypothetical protein
MGDLDALTRRHPTIAAELRAIAASVHVEPGGIA